MSKKKRILNRKCSALLAAGTGVAVCLTGGGEALAANGLVPATNGANSTFGTATTFNLFGSKATFSVSSSFSLFYRFRAKAFGSPRFPTIGDVGAGVTLNTALGWLSLSSNLANISAGNYIGVRFDDGGLKFGWVHVAGVTATTIQLDQWSYNASGGTIQTLSDSVTTSRLGLSDGKEKLHWSNDNEDGVARYEVQSKDASGEWQATDSDVPGSVSYSAKVDSGKTCRLVVEMTDGSTKEVDF